MDGASCAQKDGAALYESTGENVVNLELLLDHYLAAKKRKLITD